MANTRRALFLSVVSIFLCVAMLAGTTFAWFTDSVESTGNIIKTGTLKVDMEYSTDNSSWSDASTGAIFNYQLWEPGYTDVKYVKVSNEGNLALKYKLDILPNSKDALTLANVIDVYYAIVEDGFAKPTRENLTSLTKAGTLASLIADPDGMAHGVILPKNGSTDVSGSTLPFPAYAKEEDVTICLALKMQESAGNEYQNLSVGNGFSVRLFATQYTYENDSFDNLFDGSSDYKTADKWDGELPTEKPESLIVDPETKTITVNDAKGLLYLSTLVGTDWASLVEGYNAYYYIWDWTVNLAANIDFGNETVNTINLGGWGIFDGNGHTISNVKVNGNGLFATGPEFHNLTVENIVVNAPNETGVGAVTGTNNRSFYNVTVKNADITGYKYVGGISGKCVGSIVNCTVINSRISIPETSDEKSAGAIAGYLITDGHAGDGNKATGNLVDNVTVSGTYNLGGIAGHAQGGTGEMLIEGNIVRNSTFVSLVTPDAPSSGEGIYADAIAARRLGQLVIGENTVENVTILGADELREVNLGGGNIIYVNKSLGDISGGRIQNMLSSNRIQIAADFAAKDVDELAVDVITADGTVLTTITPEGYSIPADGNIGIVDEISQESYVTTCAVLLGNSSSWQNTSFTPAVDAEPTIMVLYVNGKPVASCNIQYNEFGTWADVIAALEEGLVYNQATMGGLYEYLPTLSSGTVLTLPEGTYETSGTLTVADGVTIKGEEGKNVVFRQLSSSQDDIINCAGDAVIENIIFESNRKGYAIAGNVKEHNTDGDITVINCKFTGIAAEKNWGIYKNLNGNLIVKNCTFNNYDNALCGINNGNDSTTEITGCTFTNINGEAIGYVISSMPADFEAEVIANNTGLTAENVIGY